MTSSNSRLVGSSVQVRRAGRRRAGCCDSVWIRRPGGPLSRSQLPQSGDLGAVTEPGVSPVALDITDPERVAQAARHLAAGR
jgi:hypothetical protein